MTTVRPGQGSFASLGSGQAGFFWQLVLIAIVLAGAGLRLRQYLFNRALWLDEASLAINLVDRGIVQLLSERLTAQQSAPPGFLLFTRGAVEAFGPHEWALRLFPFVGGVLSLVLALVLAQRELRSVAARVAFVGLLALSPLLIFYASELKQYSTDVFFTLCILVAFSYRSSEHGTALLAVTGFVALLFSLSAFFVAAAAGLLVLHEGVQSLRWRQTIVVGCAWSAGAVLHGLYTLQAGVNRGYMRRWWGGREGFAPLAIDSLEEVSWYPKALADLLYQAFIAAYPVGPGFVRLQWSDPLPWLLTIAFVLAAIAAVRTRRPIFIVALGAILFTVAASAFRLYPFSSRLIIFLTPAVLLILAAGVEELNRRAGIVAAGMSSLALLAIAGFTAAKIAVYPASISDMRGVLDLARGRFEAGDAVVAGPVNRSLIEFYGPGRIPANVRVFRIELNHDADRMAEIAEKHGLRRVWFVSAQRIAEADQIIAETERVAPVVFRWSAMGARLVLFDFSAVTVGAGKAKSSAGGRDEAEPMGEEGSPEPGEPLSTR